MLAQDYLTLRLVRLKPSEEWINKGHGLSFVFPRGGAGKYVSGPGGYRLAPGDVLVLNPEVAGNLCAPDRGEVVFWWFSLCFEHRFPLFASNEICLLQNVRAIF